MMRLVLWSGIYFKITRVFSFDAWSTLSEHASSVDLKGVLSVTDQPGFSIVTPFIPKLYKIVTFSLHRFHHAAMVFASLNSSNHLDMARKRGAPSGSYNHSRVVNPMGLMAVPFTQVPGVQHLAKRFLISDGVTHLYRILFSTESKCFAGRILVTEGFYAFQVSPTNRSPESWFETGGQVKTWN